MFITSQASAASASKNSFRMSCSTQYLTASLSSRTRCIRATARSAEPPLRSALHRCFFTPSRTVPAIRPARKSRTTA
jgi:hypothetical protein